jgi:hypothetical protein
MKKSDYSRSTIKCKFEDFKPKFIQYFKNYINLHKLGEIEKEVLHCFETTNIRKGFLGKTQTSYLEIFLTKRFLIWGVIFDKKETGIAAAQWNEISEIQDWETSQFGKMIEDHGLEMFGFIYQSSERGKWFIGLGNDEAGRECRKIMKELINVS